MNLTDSSNNNQTPPMKDLMQINGSRVNKFSIISKNISYVNDLSYTERSSIFLVGEYVVYI